MEEMKNAPTVTLTMIVKDEYTQVADLLDDAQEYFEELNIVVSDKKTAEKLKGLMGKHASVYYRPWNDRFDEARNFGLDKVTTDYWFWLDADDTFDFSTIPYIVQYAEENDLEQILLPYNYAQDEQGNSIALQWRERLLKKSHPFYWKGWIHETPITEVPFKAEKLNIPVTHHNNHVKESLDRNHAILLKAAAQTDDPRYKVYLGSSHHARGEYMEAVDVLKQFIQVSENADDVYRAYCILSECAYAIGTYHQAVKYALEASGMIPEYPQAYWLLAQWESQQENWRESLEWIRVSETKPDPNSLAVFNPDSRNQARLMAAEAEFMLKNYNAALAWLRKVPESNKSRQDLEEMFTNEADAETFIKLLPRFVKYFDTPNTLYNALCDDLRYDSRLRTLREQVTKPRTHGENSIVILCGEGYEEWGPHTLDKGMGGSEEAVVYLSRELAKLGWDVHVYGAVEKGFVDNFSEDEEPITEAGGMVTYWPWRQFDRRDNFNVFVAWRAPDFAEHVNAKVKIADIHDIIPVERVKDQEDLTYFVKSKFHRDLYKHLSDDKFRIIGNGIDKEQFSE